VAVRVPFHLRRCPESSRAVAVLLTGDDPIGVLAACARLTDPIVFPVAGGYLVVADVVPEAVPNAVRLRRLSENCYLPADADLVPALRSPESVDLTAGRGLVFLPNREPLAFDPARPLKPAAFLAVTKPRRSDWEPFPVGHPSADRLTALVREVTVPPDDLLTGEGPPVGTEDARPPQVRPGRRALGKLSAGLGKGIGAVGRALKSNKLRGLAGKLTGLAASLAPRITEDLLGRQEAALQRLLSKFRRGQVDDALRQSIPIGDEPGRGSNLYGSDQLPTNDLRWSFGGLVGAKNQPRSIWAGGRPETWRDLIAEYRRAAQQAVDRGDFRRAALIYAKLLDDYRAAAEVLSRGGLHREAGILFRDKVGQRDRAAREFEKAGEHDEAVRLYREAHLFIDAGDLLRRMGDEDAAVAEYHKAAEQAVELRHDFVEAGDLMLKKTGRADLAKTYFARGWDARTLSLPAARNATACACRLIELHALAEDREPFWTLLAEAEEWLEEPGWVADAGRFFNTVAECAKLPHLEADRGELRDRSRLGLALKLRQHAKTETTPGTAVADLLGASGYWSPAVVSDADFALRTALKVRPIDPRSTDGRVTSIRLLEGEVTATVQAPDSGDLFVGFRDGTVAHYDPESGEAAIIQTPRGCRIEGIATTSTGELVVALRHEAGPDSRFAATCLKCFERNRSRYTERSAMADHFLPGRVLGVLPLIANGQVELSHDEGPKLIQLPGLIRSPETRSEGPLPATVHLRLRFSESIGSTLFTFQGGSVSWAGAKAFIGWMPESAPGSTLFAAPVAWLVASPVHVELAGLFDNATLYWTEVERRPDRLGTRTVPFVAPGGFRGVAIWKPGHVFGVTSTNRVLWLRARGNRFEEWALPVELNFPARAVGCFPWRGAGEVLVVLEDGTLVRVPMPK
jgi:tetratricopeptide (TPR) repeat protein